MIGNKSSVYNSQSVYNQGGGGGSPGEIIEDQVYTVVDMPDGKKWLGYNLDLSWTGLTIGGAASSTDPVANYYNNDYAQYGILGKRYGLLYNFRSVLYLLNHPELIPGFHVPTKAEWENLKTALIATGEVNYGSLITSPDSGGVDIYGFNGQTTGHRDYYHNYYGVGTRQTYWTATQSGGGNAWDVWIEPANVGFGSDGFDWQHPIRLVKD